jgi:hypothetical protein
MDTTEGHKMKFCSFGCDKADNKKAQHAACLAVNGVFCGVLGKVVEKGMPCPVESGQKSYGRTAKDVKKKSFR